MNKNPKLSIIIPIYNVEAYLEKCINSVLNQTFKDIEVILVNDGATDNSGEICNKYKLLDERVKVIHKKNGGLSDARNAGIEASTGEYLGFIDGDDFVDIDMYESLLEGVRKFNTSIAMCGRYDVYDTYTRESFVLEKPVKMSSEDAIGNILTWNGIDSSSCDKIFHRSLFKEIRFPVGRVNEDIFVMYKLIHEAGGIVHIGKPKYYYVHRNNSITTSSFSKKKMDFPIVATEILDFINSRYPNLQEKAEYFYFKSRIFILNVLINEGLERKYKDEFNLCYEDIKKYRKKFLINKYIDKKNRYKLMLMSAGKYIFINIMKLYNGISKSSK